MPPLPDYPLADSFPEEVISQCKLSGLQLEGILYAVSRAAVTRKPALPLNTGLFTAAIKQRKNVTLRCVLFAILWFPSIIFPSQTRHRIRCSNHGSVSRCCVES